MSFHVKKNEAVEANQTAIIKPFTEGGDSSAQTAVKEQYEEPQVAPPFTCTPSQSPLPTISQHAAKTRGFQGGDAGEEAESLPTYVPDPAGARRRGGDNNQGVGMVDGGDISVIGVGDIGIGLIGGHIHGTTIMDQISCVVNSFTANISELNTMMLPGGAPASSTNALPTAPDAPACPPQYLAPRGRQAQSAVTTYAEVSNFCENRTAGKIYEHLAGTCVSGRRAKDMEELAALTPPSPFRDSSLSSDSSSPASPASEAEYDQLLLRHYSQSSSSL